jgi:hypothetical protein
LNKEDIRQHQKDLNRAFYTCFLTKEGKEVIEYLTKSYGRSTLRKDKTGRMDQTASIAAAGAHEMYFDIMTRIQNGELAR